MSKLFKTLECNQSAYQKLHMESHVPMLNTQLTPQRVQILTTDAHNDAACVCKISIIYLYKCQNYLRL